ncbi:class II aldolase/adducin family protein [Streptomyces sp. NPDC001339]|uniref:class II aldolase/adducin family protein n=1 Tax=Streptomyces sp. NPDC001339 TaxID=3364563 RepID=UPI0036C9A2CE
MTDLRRRPVGAAPMSSFVASLRPRPRPDLPVKPDGLTWEQERRWRQERLAGALRIFARLGYEEHLTGHISVRDPELPDHLWLNPLGRAFGRIRVSDLILVAPRGQVVHGDGRASLTAHTIHRHILADRPATMAVAHAHSVYGKALAVTGEPLHPITQDSCMFYEDNVVVPFEGIARGPEEGARIARCLGSHRVAVLANHGLLTTGGSVEEAAALYVVAERAAKTQILAAAAGPLTLIDPELARANHDQARGDGSTLFLNLWEEIVNDQPDLLL